MVTWPIIIVVWTQEYIWTARNLKKQVFIFYKSTDDLLKTHSILPVICSVTDLTEETK